jgi:general secretion pathway protein A
MYKDHFGLTEYPFSLTPDPKFIVPTASYNELLASLYYGIEMAKGLIVLTGEVGTGKTTALRWTIKRLDVGVLAAYIFNPHLSIEEFYHHLSDVLGIKMWANKSELLTQMGKLLDARHRRGLRTILIVDEAHELSDEVLEEIRLLLNFESDNAKHLQIVLTGQPELRDRLKQSNLRQLRQRVAVRCKMPSLPNAAEVGRYVTERLRIAGAPRLDIFTNEAITLIYQCSEGIPRQINNLCDNAMIAAFAADESTISRELVVEVAENLDMLPNRDALMSEDNEDGDPSTARVLTPVGRAELLIDYEPIMDNSEFDEIKMDKPKRSKKLEG